MARTKRNIEEVDNEADHESDRGFIDDDGDDQAPKSKKNKKEKVKPKKVSKPAVAEDEFWSLSTSSRTPRRIAISDFKNMKMISIREYYEKDDTYLPGKKGISLTMDQYKALLKSIPEINKSLADQGISLDDDIDDEDEAEPAKTPKKAAAKVKKEGKANIEFTSDEE